MKLLREIDEATAQFQVRGHHGDSPQAIDHVKCLCGCARGVERIQGGMGAYTPGSAPSQGVQASAAALVAVPDSTESAKLLPLMVCGS